MSLFMQATFCCSLLFWSDLLLGKVFDVNQLPIGAEITLGRPATTRVRVPGRIKLTATDSPQTVKIKTVGKGTPEIKVAIYDRHQDRVRYVTVKKGIPFLYTFTGLSSITLVSQMPANKKKKYASLHVESDKPLTLAR